MFQRSITLTEHARIQRLRQTCDGIRRIYSARKRVIEDLSAELKDAISEWHDLTNQALSETDLSKRREMRRQQSQLVRRRDYLKAEIARRQSRLDEYRNDFEINGCADIGPPL